VLSKVETEIIKSIIMDFIDSCPGALSSKIVAEHVFKVTGIQMSSFQTMRILKKEMGLKYRRMNGVS
jgi:hypothetical protein